MLITILIIALVALTFYDGVTGSNVIQWGASLVNFRYPYYHLGITYQPYELHNEQGEVYHMKSLKFGLIIFTLYFNFYTYKGTSAQLTKEDDITAKSTPATI